MSAHIYGAVTSGSPKDTMKMEIKNFQPPRVLALILERFTPYIAPSSFRDMYVSRPDYRLTGHPWRASPKFEDKFRIPFY